MSLTNKPHYVILGAGISGLSLAWELKQKLQDTIELTVLEKQPRVGGWIQTIKKEGFLFEQGPRSCRPTAKGLATLHLIEELGLQDQVLLANKSATIRYLYESQKLHKVPTDLVSMCTSSLLDGLKKEILKEFFRPRYKGSEEETIYQFFSRRFHPTVADRFLDPLVSGIFAGDIRRLSLKECFPFLHEFENKYGSVIAGMLFKKRASKKHNTPFIEQTIKSPLFTLKDGMETLPKALHKKLTSHIKLNAAVTKCTPVKEKIHITLQTGEEIVADDVFSTLSFPHLVDLFPTLAPLQEQIPYSSTVVINLGYKNQVLNRSGFGYLVPSKEHEDILGVVWDSSIFPEQNQSPEETRLTVMMGGMARPNLCELTEQKLYEIALQSLDSHLRIQVQPDSFAIKVCRQAIPQYLVGHSDRIEQIKNMLPQQFHLCGPLVKGIGINDCVANARHILG